MQPCVTQPMNSCIHEESQRAFSQFLCQRELVAMVAARQALAVRWFTVWDERPFHPWEASSSLAVRVRMRPLVDVSVTKIFHFYGAGKCRANFRVHQEPPPREWQRCTILQIRCHWRLQDVFCGGAGRTEPGV